MELISIARRAGIPMNNNKPRGHTTPHGVPTIRGRSLRATLTFGLASFMQIPSGHLFSPAVREMRAARNAFFVLATRSAQWLRLFYYNFFSLRRAPGQDRSMRRPPVSV